MQGESLLLLSDQQKLPYIITDVVL